MAFFVCLVNLLNYITKIAYIMVLKICTDTQHYAQLHVCKVHASKGVRGHPPQQKITALK